MLLSENFSQMSLFKYFIKKELFQMNFTEKARIFFDVSIL